MVKWLSRVNTCFACVIRSVLEGNANQKGSMGKNLKKSNCWLCISVIRPAEQLFRNTNIFRSKYRHSGFGILNMSIIH